MTKNETTSGDRRLYPRVKSLYLLSFVNREEGLQRSGVSMARTINLRPAGVRVEVFHPVNPGSQMEMEIAIEELILSIEGEVIYSKKTPRGTHILGIHFNEMQEKLSEKIS